MYASPMGGAALATDVSTALRAEGANTCEGATVQFEENEEEVD